MKQYSKISRQSSKTPVQRTWNKMEPRPFPTQEAANVQLETDPAAFADMGNFTGMSFYGAPPIQRQDEEETAAETIPASEEEMPLQRQVEEDEELSEDASVQAKLSVGKPGDKYEQEADNMAAQVMAMPEPTQTVQRQEEGEEETVRQKPLAEAVTPLVQRQVGEAASPDAGASSGLKAQLGATKGGGSPLSDEVRGFMEPRFGADFSGVRVHTGGDAVQMSRELGAQAFTHGQDIYYGKGKSPGKDDLTAHELTHVVQQKRFTVRPQLQLRSDDATRERSRAEEELHRRSGGQGEKDGSGAWGHDARDRGLTDRANHYMWTRVALAAESMGLTNAAKHMRHYLGNTGNPLTVNVGNMMRDVPNLAEAYAEQKTLAIEAANNKIASLGTIGNSLDFSLTGERLSDVYCSQSVSQDWFYAIGGFTYWYTAEVTVVPTPEGTPNLQMIFTLHVFDRYNWDQGKSVTIAGITVTDEQLGRLHRVGLAREFEIKGSSTPQFVTWNYMSSPATDTTAVPKGNDRDGGRSDLGRERGRHFNNIRGSAESQR